MLEACLISKFISWSDLAFDIKTDLSAILLIMAITLNRLLYAKMLFHFTKSHPFCDANFLLELARNGSEGKNQRPGNMLRIRVQKKSNLPSSLFSINVKLPKFSLSLLHTKSPDLHASEFSSSETFL